MGEVPGPQGSRARAAAHAQVHTNPWYVRPRHDSSKDRADPLIDCTLYTLLVANIKTEFQFAPLPKTNPVLVGHRWKEYHAALGLGSIVDFSWQTVQREKPELIHLLDFPYNGETTRPQLLEDKITDNKYHLCVGFLFYVFLLVIGCCARTGSVRNHGGVPDIDASAYELEIEGLVKNPVTISLKDLQDPEQYPCVHLELG